MEDLQYKKPNPLKRFWLLFKRQKEQQNVNIPEPIEIYLKANIGRKRKPMFDVFDIEDIKARGQYGPLVIKGYLLLVVLQTMVPLVLWTAITWNQPSSFTSGLRDLQDFVVAVSAGLTGVSGLAGFVIGRYFRERTETR